MDFNSNRHRPVLAPPQTEQEKKLSEILGFYRGVILDAVEFEMGGKPSWKPLRARLLKAMGDRGLEGKLRELFK